MPTMSTAAGPTALEAIIFDFDGVVVDSEPLHFRAFARIAAEAGLPFPATFEGYKSEGYIGYDDRDAFRVAHGGRAGEPLDPAREAGIPALVERKAHAFEAIAAADPVTIPGILALWDELDAAGFPYAIASGAGRADIDMMLKGLGRRVAVIVSCDDVQRSKPDPETYAMAVQRLGAHLGRRLDPARCLAIEDTRAGLASARGAGLRTLAIPTSHTADELSGRADRILGEPRHATWAQIRSWNP